MSGWRRDRDERGAVAVVVSVFSLVMVLIAAFAVDLGVQRVARRDMQSLADIVALDLVRELDGRTVDQLSGLMPGLATASADRNAGTLGEDPDLQVELGEVNENGEFVELIAAAAVPTAVRVLAETSVGFAFVPGTGGAARTAVANTTSLTCFNVGSFVAGLSERPGTLIGLLNPILGDTDLDLVSYQGLAAVDVDLLDLVHAPNLGVGTVDELVSAPNVSAGDLFIAAAYALEKEGGSTNLAQAAVLRALAVTVVAPANVNVGQVLGITTGGSAALDTTINVLELVGAAAFVANGEHFVGAPDVNLNVLNLSGMTSSVSIIEGARNQCGVEGATAETAQVQVTANGQLLNVPLSLGAIGSLSVNGPISVTADIGKARGVLGQVTCDPDVIPIAVTTDALTLNQLLTLSIVGNDIELGNISLLGGSVRGVLTADISLTQTIGADASKGADNVGELLEWTIPPDSYNDVKTAGSGHYQIPHASVQTSTAVQVTDVRIAGIKIENIPLIGGLLSSVISTATGAVNGLLGATGAITSAVGSLITNTVNPLIDNVNAVLGPLTEAVGVDVPGADVRVRPFAKCNHPRLVG